MGKEQEKSPKNKKLLEWVRERSRQNCSTSMPALLQQKHARLSPIGETREPPEAGDTPASELLFPL
jgi:hypothetical protein